MIQKSKIGEGAPSKNAHFGPVEYIRILRCFRTFPRFTLPLLNDSAPVVPECGVPREVVKSQSLD